MFCLLLHNYMQSKIKGLANAPHQTIKLTVTREKQNTVRKIRHFKCTLL